MWQCLKCRERVDDSFDLCWNCGTSRDGTEDPSFRRADSIDPESEAASAGAEESAGREHAGQTALNCLRCVRPLDFLGTKSLGDGPRWGFLGMLPAPCVEKAWLDVYCCPKCGRAEFFVSGIGEEFRHH